MQMQIALPYVILYKAAFGLLVAGVAYLMIWPFRKAKREWVALKKHIASIQEDLAFLREQAEKQASKPRKKRT